MDQTLRNILITQLGLKSTPSHTQIKISKRKFGEMLNFIQQSKVCKGRMKGRHELILSNFVITNDISTKYIFDKIDPTIITKIELHNFIFLNNFTFNSDFTVKNILWENCKFNGDGVIFENDSLTMNHINKCNFTKRNCTLKNFELIKYKDIEFKKSVPHRHTNSFTPVITQFTTIKFEGDFTFNSLNIETNSQVNNPTKFVFKDFKIDDPATINLSTYSDVSYHFENTNKSTESFIPTLKLSRDDGHLNITNDCVIRIGEAIINNKKCIDNFKFKSIIFEKLSFQNCKPKSSLYFEDCTFNQAPNFLNTEIPDNTIFQNCEFNDTSSDNSILLYRDLRIKTHAIGDEHQASVFQALEFESRYHTVLKNKSLWDKEYGLEKASSWCLKHIHNYGRDLIQPFKLLGKLTVASFLIYLFLGFFFDEGISCSGVINNKDLNYFDNTWVLTTCNNSFTASLTYALGYALGPIGLIVKNGILTPANNFIKLIEVIQFTLSSLLWFFIITSIRRRFKV
ncbi:MAG: hypothetical protein CMF60_02030 [Magnetococcales bacterium]|nr:hypothetical protein [Magnetococcales bacterium]|tara:strand:+ start:371 stop:1906 length:1536 start_codon:yes stop_codon:yes gene_type:complete